ncbi:LacI family DNA-binding transcriptional regulator [Ruegeria sp. 2012CJ41-6]|uniref:LacI family DNA-binding transcriptional regulator n=1 Tax=Ruegeria spongiae TaxID=2942209 RepID=A0ABT0PXX6_9RHOB|nr:LacI family DNA-binding transcriptional regulator [Ruegeria spongiae]MCL6282475.1 LacI family DNA-binding transcriptional regulator [Ruegeria spongiae]
MTARVTMRDVARAVGVSPMTVSRALRDDETVNEKTRHKIRQVANDLGYVYDTTAQAFRTQKSGFVAVTLPSINNANFAETFRGLSDGLGASGMQLLLGSTNYRVEKEEELVRQLLTRNPEAIVLTGGHHTDETRALLRARNLPVVEMWDLPTEPLGHVIGFSNAEAMAKLVTHLAESGRRRLGYIGASDLTDLRGAERRDGVIAKAAELGLPEVEFLDAGPAPVSMRHGAQAVSALGANLRSFDALVCVSDPVAFGVLSECRRMGLDVPGDIAITGFGNFEVASVSDPRITTIGVTAREIGEQVALLLEDVFAGNQRDGPRVVDVGSRLVRGETS